MTTATENRIRDIAREVYLAIFDDFAMDTREVADTFFDGSLAKARRCLDYLGDDLVSSEDVNQSAQGKARRGSYASLTWQTHPTYDHASREEAEAEFDKARPALPVNIKTARTGKENTTMASKTATKSKKVQTAREKLAARKAAKAAPTAKRGTASKRTAGASGRSKTASKTTTKSTGPGKREASKERDAKLTQQVLEMRGNSESYAAIAAELSITPGKAQFLVMLHRVAEGEVPKITGRNDVELGAKLQKARDKGDQYASWGWLAARSGKPEGTIKALGEAQGWYTPKADNVASRRAAANGNGKATTAKGSSTRTGKKTTAATAAAKKAAAKKGKGGKRNPSNRG